MIPNEFEHLFIYLLDWGFLFCKMLVYIFAHFSIVFLFFSLLICRHSLYILYIILLLILVITNIFFLVCLLSIKFVHDVLHRTEIFHFDVINFIPPSIFFCLMILKICLQSPSLPLDHKNVLLHFL